MGKKRSEVRRRACNILRLALLWGRKGGVFRRRMRMDLRLVPKFIKSLGHPETPADRLHYGERQLSFDDTPIFHLKMHRPASMRFLLPCIGPQVVDFDYNFDGGDDSGDFDYYGGQQIGYLKGPDDCEGGGEAERGCVNAASSCEEEVEEEEIDSKAEQFITNFYQQMKLQRQISYLEYSDMLNRGA